MTDHGVELITRFATQVRDDRTDPASGELRLGIDLGTANIVACVVDSMNNPVAGAWEHSTVVRDGIVVDWAGAVRAVRTLKSDCEERIGVRFTKASVGVPPGISPGTVRVFTNVLAAADLAVTEVVDEPVAAARVLGLTDGCVIDIGHGTTGVSILCGGDVVVSTDEPTGGHHMTLVLAGALEIPYDQAEELKKTSGATEEVFGVIRPTIEKMATIAATAIAGHHPRQVYLVGGSSSFDQTEGVFAEILGLPVYRPPEPLFVTPLGIAMTAKEIVHG
jgi:ethanolamine utilization protein EutJ